MADPTASSAVGAGLLGSLLVMLLGLPLNDVLGAFLCYKKDVDRRPLRYYSNYIDNANGAAK